MSSEAEQSDGYFGCACGKIRIDAVQPPSSSFVTPMAALCQCHDCFNFADKVEKFWKEKLPGSSEKADALSDSNASDARQIYKSDVVKITGEEYLQGIKLRENSPCIRYYSTCCGTPLMINYKIMPFFLVYQHTIAAQETSRNEVGVREPRFQRIPPTVVLNHKSASAGSAPTPEGIPVHDNVSFGFIAHALTRAIVGLVTFKKGCAVTPKLEKVPINIGAEYIGGIGG